MPNRVTSLFGTLVFLASDDDLANGIFLIFAKKGNFHHHRQDHKIAGVRRNHRTRQPDILTMDDMGPLMSLPPHPSFNVYF